MSIFDKIYVNTETQFSTALAVGGTGYVLTREDFIFYLTAALLVGQVGLLVLKYYKVVKEWWNRRGLEK